jgi:pyruvate-ferredoxin/flavodoxin oxidoreductase
VQGAGTRWLSTAERRRRARPTRRTSSSNVTRQNDDRRRRRRTARQRAARDGTYPTAPPSGRSATSPSKSRSGTGHLHPVRQVRVVCPHAVIRSRCTTDRPRRRAGDLQVHAKARFASTGKLIHLQVATRRLHRLHLCVEVCPAKNKSRGRAAQGHQHGAQAAAARAEVKNWDFFLHLPETIARATGEARQRQERPVLQPLFEFSGACAGCGETPYLKLITQLFGDRLMSPTPPAAPRSTAATCPPRRGPRTGRARPGVVELALRGQRRVWPGHARHALDKQASTPANCCAAARREVGDELGPRHARSADQRDEAGIYAQRVASKRRSRRSSARLNRLLRRRRRATSTEHWPTSWCARASGSSAATAGPTTSATAAWTTSSPAGATSTSRARHRGLLQHRRPDASKSTPARRGGQVRRRRQATPKKDLGLMAMSYGNVYVAQRRHGRQRRQTLQGHPRSRGLRRAVADHRLQPLHRPRHQHGQGHGAAEAGGAVGSLAALPLRPATRLEEWCSPPQEAAMHDAPPSGKNCCICATKGMPNALPRNHNLTGDLIHG